MGSPHQLVLPLLHSMYIPSISPLYPQYQVNMIQHYRPHCIPLQPDYICISQHLMLALRTMKMVHHDPSVSRLRENTQASAEVHLGTPRCLLNIMDATFAWIIFQTCYFGKFWHSKMHHFRSPTRPHRQALTYEVWKKNGDVLLPGQTVTLEDFPLSFRRKKVRFC